VRTSSIIIMNAPEFGKMFQGVYTLLTSDPIIMYSRILLMLLGLLLVYLGKKGILEPLLMIPMGLGMATINASTMIMPNGAHGNLFVDPLAIDIDQLMYLLQIDFLQPIYTFTFSNGLIACFIFMGIGTMLDSFGADVPVEPMDEQTYALFAPVRVSPPFFGWVFQFGGRVKILAPDDVREQMLLMLEASRTAQNTR